MGGGFGKADRPLGRGGRPGSGLAFSPDGRTFLTGIADGVVRLWQTATGKAIGPLLRLDGRVSVMAVAFSPDGKTLRMSDGREVRSLAAPVPVEGEVDRIRLWIQVMTGAERDAGRSDPDAGRPPTWQERRRRLDESAGPPLP